MNIDGILHNDIQDFINENLNTDSTKLALKKNLFPEVSYAEIINQIIAKKKAKDKLPTWFSTENIIYPEKISIEQTSSETTAKYKASLVSGEKLIDCTGGFGIDDYYFSKVFKYLIHCELNSDLSKIVKHNCEVLKVSNIECHQGDSTKILEQLNQKFDCIYIDPSRRNDAKGKVFMLADCLPNVVELQDFYYQFTNTLLIKTAPILDLHAGLLELKNVAEIHVVAVDNEVKELLWKIEKDFTESPEIIAVNIEKEKQTITRIESSKNYSARYSLPKKYVYEPNASLMKSGAFEAVSELFLVNKLHQHSHLYTSDEIVEFPGRKFSIDAIVPFQKKEISAYIQGKKMNVSTRNFPIKPEEIKKKYKIQDGGTIFAFFTTNMNNEKIILLCTKL
ncbi:MULTISPECIES: class I SAM-dependent methyltransferase [unclassified Flavobacterium]|uniref:class I SAM-dependent methyltransferase n=1 Tax=unclassified Flavobacterium TaxID=196869 RepID=UPI0012918949|nr:MULTISPECIES: class I SAM-dependent methyltransferase [unclassified Flavobacterium]MQP53513.1 class I SAM-dependent methyltransferase [Flavobacterium sp. LMO9]MQP63384.1 class I SAM-dependent methyltransferase [Flavobacterium sp. LMO6]